MRKLLTLTTALFAILTASAQQPIRVAKEQRNQLHHAYHIAQNTLPPNRGLPGNSSVLRSACNYTDAYMDYSTYCEVEADLQRQIFNGSWYHDTIYPYANVITSFINTTSAANGYAAYAAVYYDTLIFGDLVDTTFVSLPLDSNVIYLDSLGIFCGLSGNTSLMTHDSLVFQIYSVTGGNLSNAPVKTIVYSGTSELQSFYTGPDTVGYFQIPVGVQFTQNQGFLIQVFYFNKYEENLFSLSFTFNDSCGTYESGGYTYDYPPDFPALPGTSLTGYMNDSIIRAGDTAVVVDLYSNTTYFNYGIPEDCEFIYTQNWELVPIMNLCPPTAVVEPCTPNAGVTSGISPTSSGVDCITQGTSFSQTYTFVVPADVTTITIDSIGNLPSGLTWAAGANPPIYSGGTSGCFIVSGTTNAPCGQYEMPIYVSVLFDGETFTGNLASIATEFGLTGFPQEFLRVIASGNTCPVVDSTQTALYSAYNTCSTSGSITVSITKTDVKCYGQSTGSATAVPSGGSGYTYDWSNNATTATISDLASGTYSVTVTSGASTASASVTIDEPASALSVSASSTSTSCSANTGTATVNATGGTPGYIYIWSNAATTSTIRNLGASTYDVTVEDVNQCSATASTTISAPGATFDLSVSATDVACYGQSTGTATATVTNASGPVTYDWSNGGTAAMISDLTAGTYMVTVSDTNGCSKTGSATVTQPATALSAIVHTSPTTCTTSTGSAWVIVTGNNGTPSYLWSTGDETDTITDLGVEIYDVTVTAGVCSVTASGSVSASNGPSVTFQTTEPSCFGSRNGGIISHVTGGTPQYAYTWNNGATTASLENIPAGSYSLVVTDTTGCQVDGQVTLTQPNPISISLTPTNVTCYGLLDGSIKDTVTGGTGPYSYDWSNSDNTSGLNNLASGSYTVTVTDANECTESSSVSVIGPSAALTVSANVTQVTCNGGQNGAVTLTPNGGTSPYNYLWSNSSTTATISNLSSGTYSATVTDLNLCTVTYGVTITEPTAISVSVSSTPSTSTGSTGTATVSATGGGGSYTYLWSNSETASTITGLAGNTTVTVTVTDNDNCSATGSVTVGITTGISETAQELTNVTLFPNPANESLNVMIETDHAQVVKLSVTDITGKLVYTAQASTVGRQIHPISVAEFAGGVYVIDIVAGGQSVRKRFIVTH